MSASTISYPHILSIANALAYGLNTLETFGFGPFSSRYSSEQDNSSVSQKYQTIITPNGIAFSIWGIIFLSQAICVILNLFFDQLRSSPLMVNGVSWWFVLVCIAQTAWSPAFAYEKIPLSAFFMGCIFVPLVAIVVGQYKVVTKLSERGTSNGPVTRSNYWLLQFPFEIHFGWISAAFALNLNILLVNSGVSSGAQSLMAGISLALLALMALVCLFLIKRPNYTLPWVVVWATGWINYELKNPKKMITETFSSSQIDRFRTAAGVMSVILAIIACLVWLYKSVLKKSPGTGNSGEERSLTNTMQ
mmetsp:Transcript_27701/g.52515  ORF Transcript_27701/g.52515 Transcript_27701/m.52515 type:complete len:305 (-) Transcript_27701:54-968(-)